MKPNHPDMDLLEQVLQGQDAAAEGGQPMLDMVPVDPTSLMYAATQRSLRATTALAGHTVNIVLSATWIDGFAAGMSAARRQEARA